MGARVKEWVLLHLDGTELRVEHLKLGLALRLLEKRVLLMWA